MKMQSKSNQINESGWGGEDASDKNSGVLILQMIFKENRWGWSSLQSEYSGPQYLSVRKTNTRRKGLPERKELTVGKCGAPDAHRRRAGFQRRKCPRVAKSEKSMNIKGFQESLHLYSCLGNPMDRGA